ncbi:MAG: hypothetical protein A3G96_05505 [Gammaproteobacteria bacterium RIFCSPLOWO2_12_FULL_52_10]|nr:MAG: hypothetical protein A3I78_10620 [Gammaproteobacteria bacterium RIFCSPLOWO2_02_FULL_56_15]OGT83986.1 MAG: hypothetical protein A3G96_05505 [Gammaproteobacteria bacterium RIFCSPLOWO2_12_FULL_52_10]
MTIESLDEYRTRDQSLEGSQILIVDDQSTMRKTLQRMLESSGSTATVAASGEEALHLFDKDQFDLVLLDILMPGMDGLEVLKAVRRKHSMSELPVIMVTSKDRDEDVVQALSLGANDYIMKPVDLPILRARIRNHLSLKQAEDELRKAREELEQRIEERTTSLLETNKALVNEISERKQAEERIRLLAYHDELTGLPNVRLGKDRVANAIALARRNKTTVALLYLDLDDFKEINDSHGHSIGDQVLIKTAERMTHCVRETDTVARIGGDEFIIVLNQAGEKTAIIKSVEKIITTLTGSLRISGQDLYISVSIGIALYPDHGQTPDDLIKNADEAMYLVKRKGKNKYAIA